MEPTPTAAFNAVPLSVDQAIEVLQKRLELLRVDATLMEFEVCGSRNERLLAWYRGRRGLLAQELGL